MAEEPVATPPAPSPSRVTPLAAPPPAGRADFHYSHIDPFDAEEPIRQLYDTSIGAAQNGHGDNIYKQMRYFVLAQLAQQAAEQFPALDFAECGCFHGHSTHMISTLLDASSFAGRFHVFDSFEGLSEFQAEDLSAFKPTDEIRNTYRKRFASDFDKVSATLASFDFVRLYKGWIPARFDEVSECRFAFVSIDVDMYQPTYDSIAFFYPRLAPGGIMFFDDYGYKDFPGARKAVDDYLATQPKPGLFVRLPYASAFLKK